MSRDLLVARVGHVHFEINTGWPFIRVCWIHIDLLIKHFGWTFLWVRGRR